MTFLYLEGELESRNAGLLAEKQTLQEALKKEKASAKLAILNSRN